MPSAATKSATKLPVTKTALAKPVSLLAGPDPAVLADLEIIRLGIAAQAAGEEIDDAEEYAAAAHRREFGPILEAFDEAARLIGDLSTWPEEHAERLAEVEADEIKWAAEYRCLDLALTAARIEHRKAINARENLRAEDQQNRYVAQVNPMLCGSPAQAAEAITIPALTRDEATQIIGSQYQAWQINQARELKLHYALKDAATAK